MISPLTLIVVLATTLTIASPLPEPKNNAWSTKPITVDTDKWANFYCFGRADKIVLLKKSVEDTFNDIAKLADFNKTMKPMNQQGQEFPAHFDFNGKGTKILEGLSDVCKQGQADTAYLRHPLGFKNGSLTSPDSVLALAYGKWPNFTKFQYCGVLTTQQPKKTVKTPRGYSLCQAMKDPKASGTSTASKTSTAQKTSMRTSKASKAQNTSMKTPQASKRSIEE